jgi:hypothetical protein
VDAVFEATVCADGNCSTSTLGGAGVPIEPNFGGVAPVGTHHAGDTIVVTLELVRLPARVVLLQTSGTALLHRVESGGCDGRTCIVGQLSYDGTTLTDSFPTRPSNS